MAFVNLPTRRIALLYATSWHVAEVRRVIDADAHAVARHMHAVAPYWYLTGSLELDSEAMRVELRASVLRPSARIGR